MNTTEQVLLVVLGSVLALFLILSIAVVIMVLRLVRDLRRIASKAERVVDSAESVGEIFRKSTTSLSFVRFLRGVAETAMQHKKEQGRK